MDEGACPVLIMCGGRGRRLGPTTDNLPKPLVKFGNQTVLGHKINCYMAQGFRDFVFCIGYRGDMIRAEVEKNHRAARMQFSDEGVDAGILKRLYSARNLFDQQVIMTYGDTYTDIDLNLLCQAHKDSANEATIVVGPIQNPFGLVEFDSRRKVTSFREKPVLNYYIGYAVINRSAFDLIPAQLIDLPDGEGLVMFYKILMAMDKLGTYLHTGLQVTFNTQQELARAQQQLSHFYTSREDT